MENGNGNPPPQRNQLALLTPNAVVTPENYWNHMQQLQRAKENIAQYERDLQAGYQRYVSQEDELRKRIEAGREAERRLTQLQGAGGASISESSHNARVQAYPSTSNVQNAAGSSSSSLSNLQTFPPTNTQQAYHNAQMQPNTIAYPQPPICPVIVPYGQVNPTPLYQQAAQYPGNWPQYVPATNWQPQYASHSQVQPSAGQSQSRGLVSQPQNAVNGSGRPQSAASGSSQQQQQHTSQPVASGSSTQASATASQRTISEEIKRANVVYGSQVQLSQEQVVSASTAYQNVYNILRELRPEMVDYIIFAALDNLKHKLPSGAITGQSAFQKVRDQLPPHSVEQLSQISDYIVQQLQALEPGAIKAIVMRIKQSMMRHAQQAREQSQQNVAASAPGNVGGQAQPHTQTRDIPQQSQPTVISIPAAGITPEDPPVSQPNPTVSYAPPSAPTQPPSPPSLASALGSAANITHKRPAQEQPAHVQPIREQPTHPYGGPQVQSYEAVATGLAFGRYHMQPPQAAGTGPMFKHYEVSSSSPTRQTVFSLRRPQATATPPAAASSAPQPSSSGQTIRQAPSERPKSPWTPAKADKARLARDIMQSLGRPSTGSQPPSSSPAPKESVANKRKRTPSVTDSPAQQKKQRTGVEVEEIATDGAFELAVWQEANQQNERMSVTRSESSSPQKSHPANGTAEVTQSSDLVEGQPILNPETNSGVEGPPAAVDGTFAAPAQFPSVGDYLGMHFSQPTATEPLQAAAPDEQLISSPGQPPETPPRSAASAPPTSHTATPATGQEQPQLAEPATPVADAGPSTVKTPLFFPSPGSERGSGHGMDDISEQIQEQDAAGVFASAYAANDDLLDSPARIPTRLKGKGKAVYKEDDDDDEQEEVALVVARQPQRRKAQVDDSESEVERRPRKTWGRKITPKDDSDVEVMETPPPFTKKVSKKGTMVNRAYVLVPPLPKWAQQLRVQDEKRQIGKRRGRKPSTPETVPESVDELAVSDEIDEARLQEEQAQQEIVQLSFTRLHECPCRWRGCGALLNSTERLMQHVHWHAEKENATVFACEWRGCNREFSSKTVLAHHLARHASTPMLCSFEGCERSFTSAKDLYKHHKAGRHREERPKPPATPFVPDTLPSLPPLPAVMPAYMYIPRPITRHRISRVVHQWLSAKVLEDISSFRFAGRRMHHNAPSRGSRRLAEKIAAVEKEGKTPAAKIELLRRMTQDEYDFVADGRELKAAMRCEDLQSCEVTRLCEMGLVLFPPPGMEREDSVEPKSEPDEPDFLHNDQDSIQSGRHDDPERHDAPVSEQAVHENGGQQGEASQNGMGSSSVPRDTGGTAADGDMTGVDGQSHVDPSLHVLRDSPFPRWEVLPSASDQPTLRRTSAQTVNDCILS